MRKAAALIIAIIMCAVLAGCGGADTVFEQPSGDSSSFVPPEYTPVSPAGDAIPFTRAGDVNANPEAYKEKAYYNLFQIIYTGRAYNGIAACYAKSLSNIGATDDTYTALCFPSGILRPLSSGDIVYARGIIKGEGNIDIDSTKKAKALIMYVSNIEYNAANANILTDSARYVFSGGKYKAVSGHMSIEITEMFFSGNNTVIGTNSADGSLTEDKIYHFNIIVHQDGFFAWKYDCKFRMDPSSLNNYDNTLFPPIMSDKDLYIEFAPFDDIGTPLYDPLYISLTLSEEAKEPSQTSAPPITKAPSQTVSPTEDVTPAGTD